MLLFICLVGIIPLASAQTTQTQTQTQSGTQAGSTATAVQEEEKPSSLDVINNMINNKGTLFFKNAQTKPTSEKRPTTSTTSQSSGS